MSTQPDVHLSVVIPAYNEAVRLPGTLRNVLDYLSAQPYQAEVLVVDDGSTDATASIARQFASGPTAVRLLSHLDGANHGKGATVRLGMLESRGRFRLFMDADSSTTLDQIDRFWPALQEGFEVVIGSRNIEGARVEVHQPKYKEVAGRLGNLFIQDLAVPGIRDTQAGFKVFSRRAAETVFPRLTIERWGYDIEALAIARLHGFRIKEVPIIWVNAPGSKVGFRSYLEVLAEVWRVHRNLKSGAYK